MIFRYDNSDSKIKRLKGFQFHAGIAPNPLTRGSAQGHKSVVKVGGPGSVLRGECPQSEAWPKNEIFVEYVIEPL